MRRESLGKKIPIDILHSDNGMLYKHSVPRLKKKSHVPRLLPRVLWYLYSITILDSSTLNNTQVIMPPNHLPQPGPHTCTHSPLRLTPSFHAPIAGYTRPTAQQRAAATTVSGHVKPAQGVVIEIPDPGTYPAPLVLPGDDLALDPRYPAQSVWVWLRGE